MGTSSKGLLRVKWVRIKQDKKDGTQITKSMLIKTRAGKIVK